MTDLLTRPHAYEVLNTVALKKMAEPAQISDASGVPVAEVDAVLADLASAGLLVIVGQSALPDDGTVPALEEAAARRYRELREDPEVLRMHDRFEVVNGQFLTTISSWQQVDVGGRKVPNDHADADYDGKVLDRLDKLVVKLQRLIEVLTARDERFATYVRRFSAASEAVLAGDHDLVSSPTRDSVHNIWFEFHEDLLRTLGRERAE